MLLSARLPVPLLAGIFRIPDQNVKFQGGSGVKWRFHEGNGSLTLR